MKKLQSNRPIRYLSLFSGIGGFEVGIQNIFPKAVCVGFSEILPSAIQVYKEHFPHHKNLGPVENINAKHLPEYDLLVGGSPCQDLSILKRDRKGLKGSKSKLFYEYLRILRDSKPKYFILENVSTMKTEDRDKITKLLGVDPIIINSFILSAQNRSRLYWTNIPQRENKYFVSRFRQQYVSDILLPFSETEHLLLDTSSSLFRLFKEKYENKKVSGFFPIADEDKDKSKSISTTRHWVKQGRHYRKIHPIEAERLQTFPDNWTASLPYTKRIAACGNAVTCNVISMIVYNLV